MLQSGETEKLTDM